MARYDEHQRAMETYWSLRWLDQENVTTVEAVVLRENMVRIRGLPLTARLSAAPTLEPGTSVRAEVTQIDLVDQTFTCVYRESLQDAVDDAGQKS